MSENVPTPVRTEAPEQPAAPVREPEQPRAKSLSQSWLTRGVVIRVVAYTVGAHLFAGFLYLLFEVGARHGH